MFRKLAWCAVTLLIYLFSRGSIAVTPNLLEKFHAHVLKAISSPWPSLPVIYYPNGPENGSKVIVSRDPYQRIQERKK